MQKKIRYSLFAPRRCVLSLKRWSSIATHLCFVRRTLAQISMKSGLDNFYKATGVHSLFFPLTPGKSALDLNPTSATGSRSNLRLISVPSRSLISGSHQRRPFKTPGVDPLYALCHLSLAGTQYSAHGPQTQ
ncbi:hypothetical protein TNCV_4260211 [Trichonephila clavipes]|nr:hypothetical protein TNCV_4260211 [Trichonephila clavipes]